jgi:signal transduction histidine kinase
MESTVNRLGEEKIERLLQELLKYYRMGLVSRRITGIIHDLNTPLQIILTQSELMERKLQEEQDNFAPHLPAALLPEWRTFFHYRQKKNQQLQEVAYDLQKLIHSLKHRTYYADHHGIQEIDLNALLLEELAGYQADKFYKHRVAKNFQWLDRLPPILGFYVDFSQSICNLIDNALEALRQVAEPVLSITTTMEAGRRIIAVGDNGPGIPEEIQEKIFTPFFSTNNSLGKPCAGLGLFLSRRLLTNYGGEISFESRPGQTCFKILLP